MFAWLSNYPNIVAWALVPLFIFTARTLDMTLSTLRVAFIAQGRLTLAPVVGFFEAAIWLAAVGQVLTHLSNPLNALAYASGFAMGSYVGLRLEDRLAMGMRVLRIVLQEPPAAAADRTSPNLSSRETVRLHAEKIVAELRREGFGVTVIDGEGWKGPVKVLFTLSRRRDVPRALAIVDRHHQGAFFSVGDVRQVAEREMRSKAPLAPLNWTSWALRKSK